MSVFRDKEESTQTLEAKRNYEDTGFKLRQLIR
jgi:hypothetical protein